MKVVVIGGTGTLGQEITRLMSEDENHVVVFSRDELKQKTMKECFPQAQYVIGDVRDKQAVEAVTQNAGLVFHVAALKHIDTLEENPLEGIKTNVLGTINVAEACLRNRVGAMAFSSTDKAVLPINFYGHTKAMAEKYLFHLNAPLRTQFSVFRWGNVIGSRGSVIPIFVEALLAGTVKITDERMTRFWIPARDAARFMCSRYFTAPLDRACIPPMKAASVMRVVRMLADILGVQHYELQNVGIRQGEKLHECLDSTHEQCLRSDACEQYTDDELEALLRAYLEEN